MPAGAALIVLGGPAFLIGLGGGAASSLAQGASAEDLDFASVQRDNAEIERRCQEVIDRCWALGDANPILSIHDVGAGGLSNAMPELVHDAGPRRDARAARDPDRRARSVAARAVVQRGAGALRARDRAGPRRRVRGAVRARARAVGAARHRDRRRPARARATARRRAAGRYPARARARQAAADDPARRADRRAARARSTSAARPSPRRSIACSACRPSPTSRSSSRSATAPSAAWSRAIRWSAGSRSRSPIAR